MDLSVSSNRNTATTATTATAHSPSSNSATTSPRISPAPDHVAPFTSVVAYRYNQFHQVVERGVYFPPGSRQFCAVRMDGQKRLPSEKQKVTLVVEPTGSQVKLRLASNSSQRQIDVIPLTPIPKAHELLQQWRNGTFQQSQVLSQLELLPVELLLRIGTTHGNLSALSSLSRHLDSTLTPELERRKCMIFAGTDVQFDDDGKMEIGDDGAPVRDYPFVRDASGNRLIDADGDPVRRNTMVLHPNIKSSDYYLEAPDQMPPVLDQAGQPVVDAEGNVVRENPVLNAHYYTDALKEIEGLNPRQQIEALNVLTASFHADPDTLLQPYEDQGRVVFHPELQQLLTSSNPVAREWGIERVHEFIHANDASRNSTMAALFSLNGYQPQVNVEIRGGRTLRPVTFQNAHKALFRSGNVQVREFAERIINYFKQTYTPRLTATVPAMTDRNRVYHFPTVDRNGHTSEVRIPKHFDTWLGPRPIAEQRGNMNKLVNLLSEHHARKHEAVAVGLGKYLLRNVTQWEPNRLMALFDDSQIPLGDLAVLNKLRAGRHRLVQILSGPGPSGYRIPATVVSALDNQMRAMNRTAWATHGFVTYRQGINRPVSIHDHPFIKWANTNSIDLVAVAQSGNAANLKRLVRPDCRLPQAPLKDFFNWLINNAAAAPQG